VLLYKHFDTALYFSKVGVDIGDVELSISWNLFKLK